MRLKIFSTSILFILIFHSIGENLFAQEARIEERQQTFKTYPYYDPNPIANIGMIYPYFRFDGYSHSGQSQEWKMVTLENDYIKVFITPEIGGKIWGAMDKTTGKMFIYYNRVVKFRDIAMRGPWTSGGIETNFGTIGHAPTCSSPVDYILQENSDSSVSCIIGAMDLPSRTTWRMEIRLPKDKAFFETNAVWHNLSPLHQPYYHWMNSAARTSDDLELYFPGHSFIGHDGRSHIWPLNNEDRNLSFYVNNNFGGYKSYHVLGQYNGLFGGYYHNDQFGFGNWSLYGDKPGKKLWIWGLSRQGMIWEKLLTDTDGQYTEWQSGRLFNQAARSSSETPFKHRTFFPYATDKWREIWFPVKDTKGMVAASPLGVLNVEQTPTHSILYFCPLQKIIDNLSVKVNGKEIYLKQLNLNPMQVFVDSIPSIISEEILVLLGNQRLNFSSSEKKAALNRPLNTPDEFDWTTIQGMSIKANEEYKQRNYDGARALYSACLDKDPFYMEALTKMAELHYRRMYYDSALTYAKQALAIDAYDGAANFIYGIINRQLDLSSDAKDGFSLATHSMDYRSAAYAQLAELSIVEKNWYEAEEYAIRSIDYNRFNLTAYQVLLITLRKQGLQKRVRNSLQRLLKIDPLNHFARFESYLIDNNREGLHDFQRHIRGELPQETYLELASAYYNLGLYQESLDLLEFAPVNPIVFYWRAYLLAKTGKIKKSEDLLRKANIQSPYLIFPFRAESAEILVWARRVKYNWKSNYYLALIYWNFGRKNEAGQLLTACQDDPGFAPFYLTRAKYLETHDIEGALRDYRKAINLDKSEWRSWLFLSRLYYKIGDQKNYLKALQTIYQEYPKDYRLAVPYAQALYRSQKIDKCLEVLHVTEVLPFEGAGGARKIYHQAHLQLAIQYLENDSLMSALTHLDKARLWPENLGAGKPYEVDERLEDYLDMIIRNRLNQGEKAEKILLGILNQTKTFKDDTGPNQIISALVLQQQGEHKEALSLLNDWAEVSTDSELAFWAVAHFNQDREEEDRFYQKIKNRTDIQVYLKIINIAVLN